MKINTQNQNNMVPNMNILTNEDKSNLRNFAQKIHSMDINDVGKLHNGYADALTTEQKDIVAYELKLREYEIFKKRGIDPKVDFKPENIRKQINYASDQVSQKYAREEQTFNSEMTDELLEKSKEIIENTYIPVDATRFHNKDGGGINAMYNKIVAIDDNGNKVKVNNRSIQEKFRKNYLKTLSDVTGIDYTHIDDDFYNDFEPINNNGYAGSIDQNENDTSFNSKPNRVDQIDMSDYEDDDDDL